MWNSARTDLTNGLYKLTVVVDCDPPETTLISVGDLSIAVTNAGGYVFLLEKGPAYDFAIFPPSSNETISVVGDIVAMRGAALRSSGNGGDGADCFRAVVRVFRLPPRRYPRRLDCLEFGIISAWTK